MNSKIHYALVRIDTDKDIEQIVGIIETVEFKISPLTRLDVIQVHSITAEHEEDDQPIIYFP